MKHEIRMDQQLGRLLWMTDGATEAAVSLDIGPRVVHLSRCGMENLFYRQPGDFSDGIGDPEGWWLIGGHRFFLAPESEKSYWPDRGEVAYEVQGDSVLFTQNIDPWLHVQKSICLTFTHDGAITVTHHLLNTGEEPLTCALWGVNTLAGGTGQVLFEDDGQRPNNPNRTVTLWGKTTLSDERLHFHKNRVFVRQSQCPDYFKIGLYSCRGSIHHENLGQTLDITVPVYPMEQCPDGGCNIEIYLHRCFMELEALGPVVTLAPGEQASHVETWRVGLL